jgi:hypothetical protein
MKGGVFMRCYLFMADGEYEEEVALELRRKIKELYAKSKILFFSFRNPGVFAERGFAEILGSRPRGTLKEWASICQALWRRRNLRERRILIGQNLALLALVALLGGKKVTLILLAGARPFFPSSWRLLLIRRFARTVLSDDASLAETLRRHNIPAYFVGNILADLLHPADFTFRHGKKPIFSFFPRKESFKEDLEFYLDLSERIAEKSSLYFLLALPTGTSLGTAKEIAFAKGWVFRESFEGEIIEGYLAKGRVYLNLTRFSSEALAQAEYVASADQPVLVTAAGLGKTAVPVQLGKMEETLALLFHSVSLFEYNQAMGAQYGKRGALERIASFLLWGVVEDPSLSHELRLLQKRG